MATGQPRTHDKPSSTDYSNCLITPMSSDSPLVRPEHVIDALLVGLLAFFGVLLADVLTGLAQGNVVYLTVSDIAARTPTGVVAFGLTFVFQWARARGIDVLAAYRKFKDSLP